MSMGHARRIVTLRSREDNVKSPRCCGHACWRAIGVLRRLPALHYGVHRVLQ
jgi:hypothetical protein